MADLDDGSGIIQCPYCGAAVSVTDFSRPVIDRIREASDREPRTYVIIGRDWLLHRCVLAEAE